MLNQSHDWDAIVDFNIMGTLIDKKSKKPLSGVLEELFVSERQFDTKENGGFEHKLGIDCSPKSGLYPNHSMSIRLTVSGFKTYYFRLKSG